jgi:hypothetical protein
MSDTKQQDENLSSKTKPILQSCDEKRRRGLGLKRNPAFTKDFVTRKEFEELRTSLRDESDVNMRRELQLLHARIEAQEMLIIDLADSLRKSIESLEDFASRRQTQTAERTADSFLDCDLGPAFLLPY